MAVDIGPLDSLHGTYQLCSTQSLVLIHSSVTTSPSAVMKLSTIVLMCAGLAVAKKGGDKNQNANNGTDSANNSNSTDSGNNNNNKGNGTSNDNGNNLIQQQNGAPCINADALNNVK